MSNIELKKDEIQDIITTGLKGEFNTLGFELKKDKHTFAKVTGTFCYEFNILIHRRFNHYAIEIFLSIKETQIEKILKKLAKGLTGITMSNNIGIIFNSKAGEFKSNSMEIIIQTSKDIEAAIETLEEYLVNIAIPYFDKHSNLSALDSVFNSPPFDNTPPFIGGMFDERCMRGLIIAKLIHSPELKNILGVYDKTIEETMNEMSISHYKSVREWVLS